jgi:hypothetical protein
MHGAEKKMRTIRIMIRVVGFDKADEKAMHECDGM